MQIKRACTKVRGTPNTRAHRTLGSKSSDDESRRLKRGGPGYVFNAPVVKKRARLVYTHTNTHRKIIPLLACALPYCCDVVIPPTAVTTTTTTTLLLRRPRANAFCTVAPAPPSRDLRNKIYIVEDVRDFIAKFKPVGLVTYACVFNVYIHIYV